MGRPAEALQIEEEAVKTRTEDRGNRVRAWSVIGSRWDHFAINRFSEDTAPPWGLRGTK